MHTCMGPHLLLGHLQSALVLAELQQLNHTLLVGGQTGHLADNVAHKLHALAQTLQTKKYAELV